MKSSRRGNGVGLDKEGFRENKTLAALLSTDEEAQGRGSEGLSCWLDPSTASTGRHFQGEHSCGQNQGPGKGRVGAGGLLTVSPLMVCLPGLRANRVAALDNQGSPSKGLRQENEKDEGDGAQAARMKSLQLASRARK